LLHARCLIGTEAVRISLSDGIYPDQHSDFPLPKQSEADCVEFIEQFAARAFKADRPGP
jgi:hypothetical protein